MPTPQSERKKTSDPPNITVSIDTGGTFTDLVAQGAGGVYLRLKVPSDTQ